ncbi:hypothetical protein BJ912DRAFT_1066831 [Pholiota molesta]|nr:hypothetical protein BJ912DRAFT_1066831 [Pholiota molesta]
MSGNLPGFKELKSKIATIKSLCDVTSILVDNYTSNLEDIFVSLHRWASMIPTVVANTQASDMVSLVYQILEDVLQKRPNYVLSSAGKDVRELHVSFLCQQRLVAGKENTSAKNTPTGPHTQCSGKNKALGEIAQNLPVPTVDYPKDAHDLINFWLKFKQMAVDDANIVDVSPSLDTATDPGVSNGEALNSCKRRDPPMLQYQPGLSLILSSCCDMTYTDIPGMDILSYAYSKATRLLTASALAKIDCGSDAGKRQCLNYTFNDSSSLVAASLITADNNSTSALIREVHDVLEKANMDDGPELGYHKAEGDLKAELIQIQHQIAFMLKQHNLVLHSITKIHSTLDIAAA